MVTETKIQDVLRSQVLPNTNSQNLARPENTKPEFKAFGEDGLTFLDLIDIINPFQHIPFVSSFYRNITGDTIDPAARVAGGTLFFGPVGGAAAVINSVVQHETGSDLGEHAMAILTGESNKEITKKSSPINAPPLAENQNIKPFSENNPVTAWAIGELTWAEKQAKNAEEYSSKNHNVASATLPDASAFIQDTRTNPLRSNLNLTNSPNIHGNFFSEPLAANAKRYESAATLYSKPNVLNIIN